MKKTCSTCGELKDIELDYYKKTNICKVCRRITMRKWRAANKEKMRKYYHEVIKPKVQALRTQELAPHTGRITQTVVGREVERIAREALSQWGEESYWKSGEVEEGVKRE